MQGAIPELIVIPAQVELEGQAVVWAFSKKQLDMVLQDIVEKTSQATGAECVRRAEWQDLELPIICLEKYFGLEQKETSLLPKYCVLKGAQEQEGRATLVRIAVEMQSNIKVVNCNLECQPAPVDILPQRESHVLGVFQLQAGLTMIVPDVVKIWENTYMGVFSD